MQTITTPRQTGRAVWAPGPGPIPARPLLAEIVVSTSAHASSAR